MRALIHEGERAFLIVDGRATRYLPPGRHWFFFEWLAGSAQVERMPATVEKLFINGLADDKLALVPPSDVLVIDVGPLQRAVLRWRGKATNWLSVGRHLVWGFHRRDPRLADSARAVDVELLDVGSAEATLLPPDVAAVAAASDYLELVVPDGHVALEHVDGRLERVLSPGRYAFWKVAHRIEVPLLDVRARIVAVPGQEVMTKDRVSIRLNLAATVKIEDVTAYTRASGKPDELLYLAMQLASRAAVGSRTLDELLVHREHLTSELEDAIRARATELGFTLVDFGVKDIVLPGEMRTLLNRVIEAQKEAEANVITRREETAAVRSMAQTAKILGESPLLMRIKELETWKEMASKVGALHVVLGEAGLTRLELKPDAQGPAKTS